MDSTANDPGIAGKELLDQLKDNINSNFRELKEEIKSVKEENSEIKTRLESTKTPPKDVDFDSTDDFLWDSKKVEQLVESKLDKKQKQDEFKTACVHWDRQMLQDFVDEAGASLFQNNLDFKTEVEKETEKLMLVKDPAGNLVYPPDGLYNSASRVYARWMRGNKLKPTTTHDDMETFNFGRGGSTARGGKVHPVVQAGRTETVERLRLSDTQVKRAYSNSLTQVDDRGRSPRRVTVYNRKQREAIR